MTYMPGPIRVPWSAANEHTDERGLRAPSIAKSQLSVESVATNLSVYYQHVRMRMQDAVGAEHAEVSQVRDRLAEEETSSILLFGSLWKSPYLHGQGLLRSYIVAAHLHVFGLVFRHLVILISTRCKSPQRWRQ